MVSKTLEYEISRQRKRTGQVKSLKKRLSTYLTVAVLALLMAGGLYYFLRDEGAPAPQTGENTTSLPANMTFAGTSLVEQQDGKKVWEIESGVIEVDPNTKNVLLKGVKAVFYQPAGGKLELTAPAAVIDGKTRDIVLNGGIQASTSDGAEFKAQEVRYGADDHKLYGSGGVEVTREDTRLTGDALESDTDLIKVKIQGHARVIKGGAPQ